MSHTPGPWTALEKSVWRIDGDERTEIATAAMGRDADAEANARLMAAAPDLLAACKRAFDMLHDEDYEDPGTGFLRYAIEKAEDSDYFRNCRVYGRVV